MLAIVANGPRRVLRRRRGLTLIEAAMVLTILALVIAGVMLFYQNAANNRSLQEAQAQLGAIQQAVRSQFAGQANFSGLDNATIQNSLPQKMSLGGATSGQLRHAFNGAVTVAPAAVGGSADAGFTVSFAGIPVDACYKMAVMDLGRATQDLSINGTSGLSPRTPAAAQSECGTNGVVTMIWTFS